MGRRVVMGVERPHLVRVTLLMLVLVPLLVVVWAEGQDYYTLLGVNREATTREIRQAFKKLALTMHPDKNPVSRGNTNTPVETTITYRPTFKPGAGQNPR